jgi:hypothetical protein
MRVPRTRGAVGGIAVTVLGIWGALIPFVGPYFDYSVGPTDSWHWTTGRLWLSVLPGAVAILGGLMMTLSRSRARAATGALLGVLAGLWFLVGPTVSELWNSGVSQAGAPQGDRGTRVLAELGYHILLGGLIVYFAAAALGRLSIRSVRDVERTDAEAATAAPATAPAAPATAPPAEPARRADDAPPSEAPTDRRAGDEVDRERLGRRSTAP